MTFFEARCSRKIDAFHPMSERGGGDDDERFTKVTEEMTTMRRESAAGALEAARRFDRLESLISPETQDCARRAPRSRTHVVCCVRARLSMSQIAEEDVKPGLVAFLASISFQVASVGKRMKDKKQCPSTSGLVLSIQKKKKAAK